MPSNHFDAHGNVHMVDVSAKQTTKRIAVAVADVRMNAAAAETARRGSGRKGDVLTVARIAAINATKSTQHLIPLCHAIPIEAVAVDFRWVGPRHLRCEVTCTTTAKTGIEMEAMTGASVAALTVYDMLKSTDRAIEIGPVRVVEKDGGQSGHFTNPLE